MPKSDDAFEQLRKQHEPPPKVSINELVTRIGLAYMPGIGPALSAFYNYLQSQEFQSRFETFKEYVVDCLTQFGKRLDDFEARLDSQESVELQGVIAERILWGATDAKVKRFAAVLAHTLVAAKDKKDVEAATSYVRTLNELNEDDIRVLEYCYEHQKDFVLENHAMDSNYYFGTSKPRIWFENIGSLGMQVEDFYSHCLRLTGFGLVIQFERRPGEGTIDQKFFRITLSGKRLVEMLHRVET